jgi:hypothetical protein
MGGQDVNAASKFAIAKCSDSFGPNTSTKVVTPNPKQDGLKPNQAGLNPKQAGLNPRAYS